MTVFPVSIQIRFINIGFGTIVALKFFFTKFILVLELNVLTHHMIISNDARQFMHKLSTVYAC